MLFQAALTLLLIPFFYPTAVSSNDIIPAISPRLTKRLFEPLLTDIKCLTSYSAARSPSYFWDVLVEGVRDWECIDAYLHKEYYHGKDYFLIINTTEHRRCYRNKRIMSGLQQLWEATTKNCAGKGVMGVEIGEPDVAFCLVSL